jgi:hypothetical protein
MVEGGLLERDAGPAVFEQAKDAAEDRRGSVVTPEPLAAGTDDPTVPVIVGDVVLVRLGKRSSHAGAAARAEEVRSP